jgi:hypothetical protein
MKVYEAINRVQSALAKEGITKSSRNAAQGYNFRGIDAVYNALSPLLAQNGLCILPRMLSRNCEMHTNHKGNVLFYVTVEAEFDFVCTEDGSKHVVRTFGEAMDSGDKATNKAMSAAYKYAAMQAFAIPTQGDNDTENTSYEGDNAIVPKGKVSALEKPVGALPDAVFTDHKAAIEAAADSESLRAVYATAYKAAQAVNDQPAMQTFKTVYDQCKAKFAQPEAA